MSRLGGFHPQILKCSQNRETSRDLTSNISVVDLIKAEFTYFIYVYVSLSLISMESVNFYRYPALWTHGFVPILLHD